MLIVEVVFRSTWVHAASENGLADAAQARLFPIALFPVLDNCHSPSPASGGRPYLHWEANHSKSVGGQ